MKRLGAALAVALLASCASVPQTLAPTRVILIGDSTLTTSAGYGAAMCAQFRPEVTCVNRAAGGTSTKSYRAAGNWDRAMTTAKDGAFKQTFVLIQLGHNDGSERPERHTELPEYKANMARYVDEAQAAGATVILITPVTDRRWIGGKLQPGMKPWADLTAEVGREKKVPVVDLYGKSFAWVGKQNATASAWMAPGTPPPSVLEAAKSGVTPGVLAPPPEPPLAPGAVRPAPAVAPDGKPRSGPFDYVHIGAQTAPVFAGMVGDGIRAQVKALAPYVVVKK